MDSNERSGWDYDLAACEPEKWFVVFHRHSDKWWVRWLAVGRFKHVSAFGFNENTRTWTFISFLTSRLRVLTVTDAQADRLLDYYSGLGAIVSMKAPPFADDSVRPKLLFTCVSTVAHLLALPGCALRPDALYRQCLRNGGTIVVDDRDEGRRKPRDEAPRAPVPA